MGKIVCKRELARILGYSERIITEWQKEGMPIREQTERGKANQYDTEEVIRWMIERNTVGKEIDAARLRLLTAQARRAEAETAVLEGSLIPEERVEGVWMNMTTAFRQRTLALPNRLMHDLEGKGKKEIFNIITQALKGALEELAEYDPEQYRDRAARRAKGSGHRSPAARPELK